MFYKNKPRYDVIPAATLAYANLAAQSEEDRVTSNTFIMMWATIHSLSVYDLNASHKVCPPQQKTYWFLQRFSVLRHTVCADSVLIMYWRRLEMQHLSSILNDFWSSGTRRFSNIPQANRHLVRTPALTIRGRYIIHMCLSVNILHTCFFFFFKCKMQLPLRLPHASWRQPARAASRWHNAEPVMCLVLTSLLGQICLLLQLLSSGSARHVWQPTVCRKRKKALQLAASLRSAAASGMFWLVHVEGYRTDT